MRRDWKRSTSFIAAALLMAAGASRLKADVVTNDVGALAAAVTQSGTLATQGQVFEDTFSLSSYTDFMAFTTSYGGGANLDKTTAAPGGFQPNLTLYNSAGMYVAGPQATSPMASADPASGLMLDSYLNKSGLAPGSYVLVMTDWLNQQAPTATNLSDGFVNYGGGAGFVDEMLNTRTGSYALNLSASAVPEPATFSLAAPAALLLFGCFRRRGQNRSAATKQS